MFSSTARYSRASSDDGRCRLTVAHGIGLDPQRGAGSGHARTDRGALHSGHRDGGQTAGQGALFGDLSDHAHAGVATFDVGNEQESPARGSRGIHGRAGLIGLESHRKNHAGKYNSGLERQ